VASQLRFEVEAERELDEAAQRYEEQRPGLGKRFLHEIELTTERICQFPGVGAPVKHVPADLGTRQAPVKDFPYQVVYLNYGRRDPGPRHRSLQATAWVLARSVTHTPKRSIRDWNPCQV